MIQIGLVFLFAVPLEPVSYQMSDKAFSLYSLKNSKSHKNITDNI